VIPAPRLVRLIEPLIRPDFRDAITGDLIERFLTDLEQRGAVVAHLHLWREALMALRHFGRFTLLQPVNPVRSFIAARRAREAGQI